MKRAPALIAGVLLLGLLPGSAMAGGSVDQSNLGHDLHFYDEVAQTVTVGVTGKLTGVDMFLSASSSANCTVSIMFLSRTTGMPYGSKVSSSSASVAAAKWYHFELSTPIDVMAKGRFAIVVSSMSFGSAAGSKGDYKGGQALTNEVTWTLYDGDPEVDLAFKTWVVPVGAVTAPPAAATTPAPATNQPSANSSASTAVNPSNSGAVVDQTSSPPGSTQPAAVNTPQHSTPADPAPDGSGLLVAGILIGLVVAALVVGVGALGFVLGRRRPPTQP